MNWEQSQQCVLCVLCSENFPRTKHERTTTPKGKPDQNTDVCQTPLCCICRYPTWTWMQWWGRYKQLSSWPLNSTRFVFDASPLCTAAELTGFTLVNLWTSTDSTALRFYSVTAAEIQSPPQQIHKVSSFCQMPEHNTATDRTLKHAAHFGIKHSLDTHTTSGIPVWGELYTPNRHRNINISTWKYFSLPPPHQLTKDRHCSLNRRSQFVLTKTIWKL